MLKTALKTKDQTPVKKRRSGTQRILSGQAYRHRKAPKWTRTMIKKNINTCPVSIMTCFCCCSHISSSPQYNAVRGRWYTNAWYRNSTSLPLAYETSVLFLHSHLVDHTSSCAILHASPGIARRINCQVCKHSTLL